MSENVVELGRRPRNVGAAKGFLVIHVRRTREGYQWSVRAQDEVTLMDGVHENEPAAWQAANEAREFLVRGTTGHEDMQVLARALRQIVTESGVGSGADRLGAIAAAALQATGWNQPASPGGYAG